MKSILTNTVCTVYTKDIHVVTDRTHDDSFFVIAEHDGIEHDILARVYKRNENWYIWYRKKKYRYQVPDFPTALDILEKEIIKCVA